MGMPSRLWNSYKNASELNKTLIGLPVVTLLTAATSLTAIYIDARVKYDNAEQAKKCAAGTAFLTADGRCIEVAVPSNEFLNPYSPA